MTMTVAAPWNPVHASFRMTGTSTKPVPVQQLRILYSKYGTRNNRVKSLMWATRNRVHMLSPLMLLPFYYDSPVGAKRLQRARTEKAPGEGARWERQGRDKDGQDGQDGFPPGAALPVNSQDLVLEELPRQ